MKAVIKTFLAVLGALWACIALVLSAARLELVITPDQVDDDFRALTMLIAIVITAVITGFRMWREGRHVHHG